LAALQAQLEENFPNFPLLPPLDFADLKPATFLALLEDVFPSFPGLELPGLESAHIDLAALVALLHSVIPDCNFPDHNLAALIALLHGKIPDLDFADLRDLDLEAFVPDSPDLDVFAQLSNLPRAKVSAFSEDELGLSEETNIVEGTLADSSTQLRESVDLSKDVVPQMAQPGIGELSELADSPEPELPDSANNHMPQPPEQELADEPETELPSAPKHALLGQPDEASLVKNASPIPPKHALKGPPTHDLDGMPGLDLQKPNTHSADTSPSEASHRKTATTSQNGLDRTTQKQTNDASESGSNGESGNSE